MTKIHSFTATSSNQRLEDMVLPTRHPERVMPLAEAPQRFDRTQGDLNGPRVTLTDCVPVLLSRIEIAQSTARDYERVARRWRTWHESEGRQEPDIRSIGDGDFATFADTQWSNLTTAIKNWAYFSKLLRCRTPREAGRHWADAPEDAILQRVPLSGLEGRKVPKRLRKQSHMLTVDDVDRLIRAAQATGWPEDSKAWPGFYGLAWLCGIRPDDLVHFEHSGESSMVDVENRSAHFISQKRKVAVHLPLPSWLFPILAHLANEAEAAGRSILYPFESKRKPGKAIGYQSLLTRVKQHYLNAGIDPVIEDGRKLWLYGFRKASVTWWLTNHPGWQKQVNGHSVAGDVAKSNYAQFEALRPIVETHPAPPVLIELSQTLEGHA